MRTLPQHITVRVDPRTAADLHLHAVNHGTTASALLRAAIRATLKPASATGGTPAGRLASAPRCAMEA